MQDTGRQTTTITVTYGVRADSSDVNHELEYVERIEIIGRDQGAGEDGTDEVIAAGVFEEQKFRFTSTTPATRSRTTTVASAALDEDVGLKIERDELQARVTLTPTPVRSLTGLSNIVLRQDLTVSQT